MHVCDAANEVERFARSGEAEAASIAGVAQYRYLNFHVDRLQLWRQSSGCASEGLWTCRRFVFADVLVTTENWKPGTDNSAVVELTRGILPRHRWRRQQDNLCC